MSAARRLLLHRHVAVLLCAATLLLKLLVPAGYMIGGEHGRIAIELCSGVAPLPMSTGDMAGMHHDRSRHGGTKDHGRAEMPCAFAGLTAASLAGADPVQLAALIGFVLALGLCPAVLPAIVRWRHARPRLRAPPLFL